MGWSLRFKYWFTGIELGCHLKKVSIYVDEALWNRLKEEVLRKHGTLRNLSAEVESLIRSSLVDEEVRSAFNELEIDVSGVLSPEEIERDRPKLRGPPSEELVGEMRGRRLAEALP